MPGIGKCVVGIGRLHAVQAACILRWMLPFEAPLIDLIEFRSVHCGDISWFGNRDYGSFDPRCGDGVSCRKKENAGANESV